MQSLQKHHFSSTAAAEPPQWTRNQESWAGDASPSPTHGVSRIRKKAPLTDTVTLVPNQGWDARILVCRCGALVDTFIVVSERYVVLIDTLINRVTAEALLVIAHEHLPGRQLLAVN